MTITEKGRGKAQRSLDETLRAKAEAANPIALVVAKFGAPYLGIRRPKGYRHQRIIGACFRNALLTACEGRGTYVEGFACKPGMPITHHAWITIEGETAIDQTWSDPEACSYFGIAFQTETVARAASLRDWWGMLSEQSVLDILNVDPRIISLPSSELRRQSAKAGLEQESAA
jgi:hypothetical protein